MEGGGAGDMGSGDINRLGHLLWELRGRQAWRGGVRGRRSPGFQKECSSYSSAALEFEKAHNIEPVFDSPRMSRRSLRLHAMGSHYSDGSLLDSSHNHSTAYSTAYSAGGSSRKETRTVRSRRQQQLSSTPQTLLRSTHHSQSGSSSLHSCMVSNASLLSGMLDESCIQERTQVDGLWGLDDDTNLKERSLRTEHSAALVNGDVASTCTETSTVNGYICSNCSLHSERKDALTAYSSSSSAAFSRSAAAAATSSTIYRSRRDKTGVLASFWQTTVRCVRRPVASLVSLVGAVMQSVLLMTGCVTKGHEGKGVLTSFSDTFLTYGRWVFTSVRSCMLSLKQNVLRKMGYEAKGHEGISVGDKAHSSYCGSVNVKGLVSADRHLNLNGSLCDDCKGKQHLETLMVRTQPSRMRRLMGALWSLVAYTGYSLLQAGLAVCAAGLFVTRKLLSVLWLAVVSPGKAATGVFWWLGTGWYHLVTLMSLFNVFVLTRCLPKLCKLLLFLLPFLLLLGLWYWGSSSLLAYLPVVSLTEWWAASPLALVLTRPQTLYTAQEPIPKPTVQPATMVPSVNLERLARLEERLEYLWGSVEKDGQLHKEQHREVMALYRTLADQLVERTDRDSLALWVSGLLDQRLTLLRKELHQDTMQRDEQYLQQQQSHTAQLSELEALLRDLAAQTKEVQQKQKEVLHPPAPESMGVTTEEHSALLVEVQRLEAELKSIKQDLQGVMGCRGRCEQLDTLQDTVSAQVRRELRTLFYGGEQVEQGDIPEPLLTWLSAHFVRGSDLQGALASLESAILKNISLLWADEKGKGPSAEEVTKTVAHTTAASGMSEEQVELIVQNALKLYSQDRIGQVDYALESGGGSILSTRCSETYETKTALMSLFGVPLWYFSQSPRVVIQPDVYPGNCWAFKGSQGYLVIRLSMSVLPTGFSLEHIPKSLSPTGNISSAPRNFSVYGLEDEYQEEGKLLGQYTYLEDGDSLQTFTVEVENDLAYQIIEMRVLSNWGHPEYTCLYRFRVHGKPKTK
ncbi:SUN domain-containing protein 1 isoform X1 [Scleropages formosus]|uniref:SUN domain-containing protein 1 isoform X1 n=2 Tax=Scleropages formosus TaxID=113540 RepID=UPI0010FACD27|nr:SUN domain-containing protein 1 isoform X1 [Scleropages formosus]